MAVTRTPVVVVGGGPVGLTLALELAHHGVACVVVEPRVSVERGSPRAKTTSSRSMELYRRTGMADEIRRRAGIPLGWSDEIRFCTTATGLEITRITGTLGLDLAGSALTSEAGQQVPQPAVEEVLRDRLASDPLVTLRMGWHATRVGLDGEYPRVEIEAEDGRTEVIDADYVVGADGSRSVVRVAIGARYEGAPGGRPNVNITFRSQQLGQLLPERAAIHHWVLNPAAPGVVGPLDLNGTWWAISTGTESIADEAEAILLVRALVGAEIDVEIIATDPWQARLLLADSYGSGRAYLAGDAAHQNPPWGGHGYNTGVGDAVNLAWKLAAVINGWAPPELLESYEEERRPIAQQTIDFAATNMKMLSVDLSHSSLIGTGPDADAARSAVAQAIQKGKRAEFHSLGLVLGYGYGPDSAAQAPSGGIYLPQAKAGNRLPHARTADGRSLFDQLGPEITVLGSSVDARRLYQALADRGIPAVHVDAIERGFARDDVPALALVRPDQHLAWVSDDGALPDDPDMIINAALRGFTPTASP